MAAMTTTNTITGFLRTSPMVAKYALVEADCGRLLVIERITAQIATPASKAGTRLICSTPRHEASASSPAVTMGPSTSPALPPMP